MAKNYSIGALARRTGASVQTIRYYEEQGLMPPAERTAGNQRRYDERTLDRLGFIRHARELGFPLERIRIMLDLADEPDRSCADVDRIAGRQLADVEARIARLEALRAELQRMVRQCQGGRVANCRIIEVLKDARHGHCLDADHGRPTAVAEDSIA
ncbi:MerR family transcriptional regulator [Oceanibacterium hippocampi]|uniref:HTH-type transcriptional regulator ZntR n=1 Tax=Oceanibacterium hippocampi TaxID=745714 RepID=A0A1Y5T0M1_9PROT|nr:helix-turn-helix domain-containing protein [Oceanibacterium hippocampi]SLN49300.1 HTH-type transcriptional regulator ZntR [Oceanibacterium hippocampi]